MMEKISYEYFELEDFLSDEKFQDWVLKGDHKDFWNQWLLQHQSKCEIVEEARFILKNINFQKNKLPTEWVDEKWLELRKVIEKDNQRKSVEPIKSQNIWRVFRNKPWLRRAATVSIVVLASILGYRHFVPLPIAYISYSTDYNEKKEISLPDGSSIKLNANSKIFVPEKWNMNNRKVEFIYGEAYFDIVKKSQNDNPHFVIHTNGMDVTVLGTSFNVNSRHRNTSVALVEGSVRLRTKGHLIKTMLPSQVINYDISDGSLSDASENLRFHTAWLSNTIVLDNISLEKIAQLIEDYYGKKVQIEDNRLRKRELSGNVSDGDINIIIRAIESSLDIKAIITQDKIIFKPKK